MTDTPVSRGNDDGPDQLREQFRQLLRYRWLIGGGVGVGLLGGAWLGVSQQDTYVATSDIVLRAPTNDPFNPSVAIDKTTNMGSERQTALSSDVARAAARSLGLTHDPTVLQHGLQVTTPPQTMVLRFTYTGASPGESARRANALADAYLTLRRGQWQDIRDSMIAKYRDQLTPLTKRQEELAEQTDRLPDGPATNAAFAAKASVDSRITELNGRIGDLKALDMSPGAVIREAVPPRSSDGPGIPLTVGLGGAVGVALGLLGAWVRLVFDPSPRSPGEVARALRTSVLGTVPRGGTGPLVVGSVSDSRVAEEYRSIAFRLAYDERFAGRRRLLVVSPRGSVAPAAAVASNLAASFAETGKKVLLVEADLRAPSLARVLGVVEGGAHWMQPPSGDWPTSGHLAPVAAGESGIFSLMRGERVRNVPRTLTSGRMTRLIEQADDPDSTVVVLAPPVLAYADALALVDRVDGVLVVCDPRAVHRSDLARIRELISGAGGTVLGAVQHTDHRRRERPGRRRTPPEGPGGPAEQLGRRVVTEDPLTLRAHGAAER